MAEIADKIQYTVTSIENNMPHSSQAINKHYMQHKQNIHSHLKLVKELVYK